MFKRVLIANRGEIACRIIHSLHKLNIQAIGIYSSGDSNAKHVHLSDEAYWVGHTSSADSYLHIENIIAIAKQTKVDAIHPGYGFLSENAEFATACSKANIIFIGPSSEVIAIMGSKSAAKQKLLEAKVPILPGYNGADQTPENLLTQAKQIGFPVLIKASFGGGGKGMQIVEQEADFLSQLEVCKRNATTSFGRAEVIIEKYLVNPRHIEIQIIADNHGNVMHLHSRDCSVQRRYQKIIEEAPALGIEKIADSMYQDSINIAKAINYQGVGTIEYLVTDNSYYFMEMNTRLQVEHPVTEEITNLDLVEWQLRIAANQTLDIAQPRINGHAIEVRLYAEDPENNFLPTTGKILQIASSTEVRIDSGIKDKDTITIHYDPLLAKLISHALSRKEAIYKLKSGLLNFHTPGLNTNKSALLDILDNQDFHNLKISTQYIDEYNFAISRDIKLALCCAAIVKIKNHNSFNNWRLNYDNLLQFDLQCKQTKYHVEIYCNNKSFKVTIGESSYNVTNVILKDCNIQLQINGETINAYYCKKDDLIYIAISSNCYNFLTYKKNQTKVNSQATTGVISPMPGVITKITTSKGSKVNIDDPLLTMEAMKMEHCIVSPIAATVKQVFVTVGDTIDEGIQLVEFE